MSSRRAKCYSLRKNKLRKKHDIVFVVRVEIRHHHFIDFFFECFENESMQNYSEIECECQIMYFKWRHYHRNIVERDQNENVHSHINEFETCVVQCLVQKNLANTRLLRSNLSRRYWRDSFDEELIQLTNQIWSFLRTAKHFVSYHFSFRHFDHFRRRVNRETHQEVEIQRECEAYTRIDESRENILQRSKYSRCFHRQFRRSSLFDRECQSIIEKNHLVWRKNSNVYRCKTDVD
jgi:hypothetical protein